MTHWRLMQGIPDQIWIIRAVENSSFSSTLRAWLAVAHHRPTDNPTGVTTKQIPCGKLPIPTFPNQGKEHSVGFLSTWEGGQDTLPNSGRVRVGSNYYFVIPGSDPESHSLTLAKGLNILICYYLNCCD